MRERLGEFIFDGDPFEDKARFVILESSPTYDNGKILVSSHLEGEDYNEVPITSVTAREMAGQLMKMAAEAETREDKINGVRAYGEKTRLLVDMWVEETKAMGDLAPGYMDWLQRKLVDVMFKAEDTFKNDEEPKP